MRFISVIAFVVSWAIASASPQQSAQPAALPDIQKLGPQVGDRVPEFTLQDQNGRSRTLQSLMGRNGLMLVFYRSADW